MYRWNPRADAEGDAAAFQVDSAGVRGDVAAFLAQENALTLLSRGTPLLSPLLAEALSPAAARAAEAAAASLRASYDALVGGSGGLPPLLVAFASDGGNAEALAKRVAVEAKRRGFPRVDVLALDSVGPEELAAARLLVGVVSTAGQGEFPQNGRAFAKRLSAPPGADAPLRFAVFGLGDSHYWPRKEQSHFFNKAAVDLDGGLEKLGGQRVTPLGLGDDQSVGGYQADFRRWVQQLWVALGVALPGDGGGEGAPRVRNNEAIKTSSRGLRGTIAHGLQDASMGALSYEDTQLTKFHGIYQQDDRDVRGERKAKGLEPAFSFMVRVRIPGGVATPAQYAALDDIADTYANGTIRATTRQAVQFHGIIKEVLKPSIAAMNRALMDTLAACGDVNRNVMCNAAPDGGPLHDDTLAFARLLSEALTPATTAYSEIWLDGVLVRGGEVAATGSDAAAASPNGFGRKGQ